MAPFLGLSPDSYGLLLRLGDATRTLHDPREIVLAAMRLLREHLGVDRCAWAEVEADENHFAFIGASVAPGVAQVAGRYPVAAFGAAALRVMRSGSSFVCTDAWAELPGGADQEAYRRTGIRALIATPVFKNGRFVAGTGVHVSATPRAWTAEEVRVIEEVTERCWESIERARAEQALRASELQFRAVADALPQLVWIADSNARVLHHNRRWAELTGKRSEDSLELRWLELVHPDDRQASVDAFRVAVEAHALYEVEHRIRCADGSYRWFLSRALPVAEAIGQVERWFGTSTDIEEQKQAERRKDEFLAMLAHELRNPLAPISNAVHILGLDDPSGAAWRRARGVIERQVQIMVRLIDDLLDVSRITQGRLVLRRRSVDLIEIIRLAAEDVHPHVERAHVQLTLSLPDEPIMLSADPERLGQVFSNLLHNACKYTDPGGRVRLTVARTGDWVELAVEDTGIGIAAEQLEHMFEMFTQLAPRSERARGGLGIGLALAQRLVALHGGTIAAMSPGLGKGARFEVRLPITHEIDSSAAAPGDAESDAARATPTVLVVDDNREHAQSLAMVLEMMGLRVLTAFDGLEAVASAQRHRPDVVLLDLGMPVLDGLQACQRIRREPWGKSMLIVAQTGWGAEGDRRKTKEAGFDAHLVKPVNAATLAKLILSNRAVHRDASE